MFSCLRQYWRQLLGLETSKCQSAVQPTQTLRNPRSCWTNTQRREEVTGGGGGPQITLILERTTQSTESRSLAALASSQQWNKLTWSNVVPQFKVNEQYFWENLVFLLVLNVCGGKMALFWLKQMWSFVTVQVIQQMFWWLYVYVNVQRHNV